MRALRVLFGLFFACLVAAFVLIGHVIKPLDLLNVSGPELASRLAAAGELLALVATHLALFALPFGLLMAVIAETNRWRGVGTYLVIGLLLAGAGYLLHLQSESELATVANLFAIQVFVVQGLLAGWTYWWLAGRFAGWRKGGGLLRAEPLALAGPKVTGNR